MSILKKIYGFRHDNLFRNSFYLMLTTGVMAVLGFVFWLICARLFTPVEVGEATSLISAMTLISYLSLLGFNVVFVRILPTSKNKDNEINTGLILSVITAVLLATVYIIAIPVITPILDFVRQNIYYSIGFVAMVALATVNLLTDSIFIAYRGAKYNLLINGFIMGGIKLILPVFFVSLGAYGLFAASGSAASVAMVASILFLVSRFGYKPGFKIHLPTLKTIRNYLSANYIANLFNIAPILILPIIVLDNLGAASAGYYYLAITVANLLYAVVYSVSSALFAEGSYGEIGLKKLFIRATVIITIIMIPLGFGLALIGPMILHMFGKSYSDAASQTIIVLALSAPMVAAYTLGNSLLRIKDHILPIVAVNLCYALSIIILAYIWVDRGLVWVAYAWMAGNLAAALVAFCSILFFRYRNHSQQLVS